MRLIRAEGRWLLHYAGRMRGDWRTPDDAAGAVAQHRTGLPAWDRQHVPVPGDLLEWRPLGESI